MLSSRNCRSVGAVASGMTAILVRPKPFGARCSTAMATRTLPFAPRPRLPGFNPAEEHLVDLHVTGERLATGSHHRRAKPVRHRPRGLVGAEPEDALEPARAEMPLFGEVRCQEAANQMVSGVRVSWKIVPAVDEILFEHVEHIQRPSPIPPATRD